MDCTQSPLAQQALPRSRHAAMQDVTVIGAGPAGALLAYLLAVRGRRVVLLGKMRKQLLNTLWLCSGSFICHQGKADTFALDSTNEPQQLILGAHRRH